MRITHANLIVTGAPAAAGNTIKSADYRAAHVIEGGDSALIFDDFGAIPNDSSSAAKAANNAAFVSLLAHVTSIDWGAFYKGAPKVIFPSETYYFSGTVTINKPLHLQGYTLGFPGQIATQFYFPGGVPAIDILSPCIFDGFFLEPLTQTSQNILHAGIRLRSRATVRNCWVSGFAGPGILISADALAEGDSAGNANGWQVRDCRISACKYSGIYTQGGDANAGMALNVDVTSCGRYGIEERSFLGNTYINVQAESCGVNGNAGQNKTSYVSDGTWQYRLIDGQDANAATTPPTTGASNSVWKLEGAGGPALDDSCPLYEDFEGQFQSGGSYFIGVDSNARNVLVGCYAEGNQATPVINGVSSFALGGFMGTLYEGDGEYVFGTGRGLQSQNGFMKGASDRNTGVSMETGVGYRNLYTISHTLHGTYAPNRWQVSYGVNDGGYRPQDIWTHYNGNPVHLLTGPSTLEEFGTGDPVPYVFHAISFAMGGYNDGSARRMTYAAAAPASGAHAQGEIVWNNAPAAGGTLGWVCTTAGTPGTWKAISGIAA